jgi:hypothetical protein
MTLDRELVKNILKNIGATPISIGKCGLTDNELLVKNDFFKVLIDNEVKDIPMWYGEISGFGGLLCCLLTSINNEEYICIIGFKDVEGNFKENGLIFGFNFDWTDDQDPGIIMLKTSDKWVPIGMVQKLKLALGFENIEQEGLIWKSSKLPKILRKNLSEMIELDVERAI